MANSELTIRELCKDQEARLTPTVKGRSADTKYLHRLKIVEPPVSNYGRR